MGKFLVRITVILVAIYFIFTHFVAQICGVDIHYDTYILLFELIAVVYSFSEGKFHCKYLRYTIIAIFFSELITRLDFFFNFLSVSEHNLIPICLIVIGLGTSVTKALLHFYKVSKYKQKRKKIYGSNFNAKAAREHEQANY